MRDFQAQLDHRTFFQLRSKFTCALIEGQGPILGCMFAMPDRNNSPSKNSTRASSRSGLALRFISGKYQGGEFPLDEGQQVIVGRSSELDMVLVEEMVSRRHALISLRDGVLAIEDLGSTNGTFVNGEKVMKTALHEGDRILIGTNILKVVRLSASQGESRKNLDVVAKRRVTARQRPLSASPDEAPRMTGNLEEIPLADLLQLFGSSRKSGVLVVRTDSRVGRILLDEGRLHFALIEGQPDLKAFKAIYRMLEWKRGFFELEPPDTRKMEGAVDLSVQEVLMEAIRQQDEFATVREQFPPLDARLALKTPLLAPLHELDSRRLEVLQTALNCPNVQALLEKSNESDLDTARIVVELIEGGYLQSILKG
jgi:pSer/pThr/pTyr-binding forkhead associated (FHA) protein